MISWFKKHFIPHAGNGNRPHFLRKESMRNILLVVLFIEIFTFLTPFLIQINRSGGMATVLPSILSDLTNQERQTDNLKTLTVSPILTKAAEMKAEDMATKSYFAHTSPEGITPWYWLIKAGYQYQYAGENLAINFTDSKDVTTAWMNSPTHKANIIKQNYTEMGTGIATGMYQGRETVFVAQVYANPLIKNAQEAKPTNTLVAKNNIEPTQINKQNSVLGAETKTNIETTPIVQEQKVDLTPTQATTIQNPNILQKIIASPRHSSNTLLFIIIGIILLSLILNIIIKVKYHHPDLITNGLVTIVVIGFVIVANYYLTQSKMTTIPSADYSYDNINQ